jgi:hypothetical protein
MATHMPLDQKADGTQHSARWRALFGLEEWLRVPMLVLSAAWLGILVLDLTGNSGPALETVGTIIWLVFIAEFVVRFVIAPEKRRFLGRNVLTIVALLAPALRLLRIAAIARASGVVRLPARARGRRRQPQHERAPAHAKAPGLRLCRRPDRRCLVRGRGGHVQSRARA